MKLDLIEPTTVTKKNINVIRDLIPLDHAEELQVGCVTWKTYHYNGLGRPRGHITVWPNGRAAVLDYGEYGNSTSDWGDWREKTRTVYLDDGTIINEGGCEVEVSDDEEEDE